MKNTLTHEIKKAKFICEDAIKKSENDLSTGYNKGRIDAFQLVLDLIDQILPTELNFKTEEEFLLWQDKENEGNTIYALQTTEGYFGDIREEFLLPLWNENKIVSLDNPKNEEEQRLIDSQKWANFANWGVLPQYTEEVKSKLIKIKIG